MNTKTPLFCFLMFFLFFGIENIFSQKAQFVNQAGLIPINENYGKSSSNGNVSDETKTLFSQVDGTFQVQLLHEDYKVLFSKNLYQMIIDKRLEDQDVFVTLDENSILFIPSSQKIRSINFEKLSQTIFIKR